MTIASRLFATATFLLIAACNHAESASNVMSNYPPDYAWNRECMGDQSVDVCRENQGGYRSALKIYYKGSLRGGENLRVYVKLNGKDGVFPLDRLGSPDGIQAQGPSTTLSDGARNCRTGPGGTSWVCDDATPEMQSLFTYAIWQYRMNAWDLELAFVDGDGNWDSRYGANYLFRFQER